jgi:hypothetical protein
MKIVSFSLWGNKPIYNYGAIENAKLLHKIYPGWEAWFYVNSKTDNNVIETIKAIDNCKIIFDDSKEYGMCLRFKPMLDSNVDIFISRDCDSRINYKEQSAVNYWLNNSNRQFHCMRDNKQYHSSPPVMGGMWGAKRNGIINLSFLYDYINKKDNEKYFDDQKALTKVYNNIKFHFLEHDDNKYFSGVPFPDHDPIQYGEFVGQRIDENNIPLYG